jgi:hypothetical protein
MKDNEKLLALKLGIKMLFATLKYNNFVAWME